MSLIKKCLSVSVAMLMFLSSIQAAQAILLTPIITLTPYVVKTTPTTNERVVSFSTSTPIITVLFSEEVKPVTTESATLSLFNNTDSVNMPLVVSITNNTLFAETGGLTPGKQYTATIHGDQVRRSGSTVTVGADYTWTFKTAAVYLVPPFFSTQSEPIPSITIEQSTITPTVNIVGSGNGTAKYRIRIENNGGYSLSNVTAKVVLPPGFTFDALTGASSVTTSGTTILTFTYTPALSIGETVSFDYAATVNNSVIEGTYNNTAIVEGTFIPSNDRYDIPRVTAADDNRENDENVTINHTTVFIPTLSPTFVLPTILPTITSSPTPTVTATPTPTIVPSTLPFSHPSSDPLTCLQLNGAAAANFSDVPASLLEAPYVSFLNTTVFASNPDVRLSRGYSNGTFGASNTLTRFELTKMALGANCINYTSSTAPNAFFTDVPTDNSEMSLVIGKAKALGIVQGVGNQFFPNRAVSYGEMVKILVGSGTYFNHGVPTTSLAHTLNGVSDESFRQFAEYSARMNLVNLTSGNTFPQNDSVQRRFMAQAVARYIAWLKNISIL